MRLARLLLAAASLAAAQNAPAPAPVPGSALPNALFALREIDMHYHSGIERQAPLNQWIDIAAADGRKVLLLMDHLELYRRTQEEYTKWLSERLHVVARYPMGPGGQRALFADFTEASGRNDLLIFRGWEVYEGELDTGIEPDALRLADVLGWHIGPNHGSAPPDGKLLIHRAEQLIELQKQFPVPMVLLHPFTMRAENLERIAKQEGRPLDSITVEQYRFFTPDQQKRFADAMRGQSVYMEIESSMEDCFRLPHCRQAAIEDIRPLAAMGVQFTVSTDAHGIAAGTKHFHPEDYAGALGVTPANANTIVRELLAARARSRLAAWH